ncbi:MAG: hypothetical protein RI911_876 [Candidatus Parcubacteria bacterium]|jgi:peptidoglycan hydrolase-like protein with peptidoglycan-binding domain
MKQYLYFIVLAFLVSTGVSLAAESVGANGPISGQNISFPKNGTIPASVQTYAGYQDNGMQDGMGGIGNTESCLPLSTYHKYGSRGASVAELQTLLNTYTNAKLPVTGFYGTRTVAAVKTFQRAQGIRQTGAQFSLTTAALNKLGCVASTTVSTSNLQKGARGAAVSTLQMQLNAAGYPVPVTGFFGTRTAAAVSAYQKAHGLKVTGIVGPYTKAGLARGAFSQVAISNTPITSGKTGSLVASVASTKNIDPVVTVTNGAQAQQAAVAESSGFFNGSTLPWILLALAAGFGYVFGPWRKKEEEKKTTV